MRDQSNMQKGHSKVPANKKVFDSVDTITGKRRVQVNRNTWVYTDEPTDQEAINKFNKLHNQNIMKTLVAFLTVAALFFTACSKDETVRPDIDPNKVSIELVDGMQVTVNGELLKIGNTIVTEPGSIVVHNIDNSSAKLVINFRGKVMSYTVDKTSSAKLVIKQGYGIF